MPRPDPGHSSRSSSGRLLSGLRVDLAVWLVTIMVVGATFQAQPSAAPPRLDEGWIDTSDRAAVMAAYSAEYGLDDPAMNWSGSHEGCYAGGSSTALALATIRRLNFYRAMAGVEPTVRLNADYSALAQQAALMMSAEGTLTHDPDPSFACFGSDGHEGAANSNLYLGRTGAHAIDGYVEDPGDRNRDVGHRLTILHPPTRLMGVGHVAATSDHYAANALWVFDEAVFDQDAPTREADRFVAWPSRGFVPERLVYPRWSFALADADMSQAEVALTVDGQPVEANVIERISKQGEVPSSVLVWEPQGLLSMIGAVTPSSAASEAVLAGDLVVEVVITGVRPPAPVTTDATSPTGEPPAALAFADQAAPVEVDPDGVPDNTGFGPATEFHYTVVIMAEPAGSVTRTIVQATSQPSTTVARSILSAVSALG